MTKQAGWVVDIFAKYAGVPAVKVYRRGDCADADPVAVCDNEAAARLIAAAPDLLAALEDAEFLLRKLSINPKEIGAMLDSLKRSAADAREAIAKARGE